MESISIRKQKEAGTLDRNRFMKKVHSPIEIKCPQCAKEFSIAGICGVTEIGNAFNKPRQRIHQIVNNKEKKDEVSTKLQGVI